ncbi:MAG: PilT/PilU family type 4a pilus ATPase, partial [Bdellovibrionales bacterium]|nr:PilT/PilU family type 4a pilus ATPase [Bdellovibrionales bacterium]
MASFDEILSLAYERDASDVHLKAGVVPVVRRHGRMLPLSKKWKPLRAAQLQEFANKLLTSTAEKTRFEHFKEIDLGYGVKGVGRFRINIFQQRGSVRIVARVISDHVPEFADLKLPSVVERIANIERGLILVTGVTGSGKSTTLAAMINHINHVKNKHIITIEDPIEYLIRDHRSLVSQREIGLDTTTFSAALRAALRQDPDVIFIGEMRDKETIETALTAAETGHLVLSTLHTFDAQETVNRILSAFENHQQAQVRRQLAGVLKAVVSQRLATRKDKKGVIPAVEVMINNARIREMIEDPDRTNLINHAIETSAKETGMRTFDQSLIDLITSKTITLKEAMSL